jgi:acyl-CoA thioester hydrolase
VREPFRHRLRVRYAECDAQGVVFNSHYLGYFDISMTELWRAAFGSYRAMLDHGVDIVVAEAHLRFLAPARFDEELTLEVGLERLGTTSIASRHRILYGETLLVEGALRHVVVGHQTVAKTPIPDWLREGLAPYAIAPASPGPTLDETDGT